MTAAYKPGDTDQLTSGGPCMTVLRVLEGGNMLPMSWFAGRKNETAAFPTAAVIPCNEDGQNK